MQNLDNALEKLKSSIGNRSINLYLIRHGHTLNKLTAQDASDTLTELGKRQLAKSAEFIKNKKLKNPLVIFANSGIATESANIICAITGAEKQHNTNLNRFGGDEQAIKDKAITSINEIAEVCPDRKDVIIVGHRSSLRYVKAFLMGQKDADFSKKEARDKIHEGSVDLINIKALNNEIKAHNKGIVFCPEKKFPLSKNIMIMMIGHPGSGKSTWANKFVVEQSHIFNLISTDNIFDKIVPAQYREQKVDAYDKYKDQVFSEYHAQIETSVKESQNVILDRAYASDNKRQYALDFFHPEYLKVAIHVTTDQNACLKRVKKREDQTGRKLDQEFFDKVVNNHEAPSFSQFDIIIKVNEKGKITSVDSKSEYRNHSVKKYFEQFLQKTKS